MTTKDAVTRLQKALRTDKKFRETYHANISFCICQEMVVQKIKLPGREQQKIADGAAERFLKLFCDDKPHQKGDNH